MYLYAPINYVNMPLDGISAKCVIRPVCSIHHDITLTILCAHIDILYERKKQWKDI